MIDQTGITEGYSPFNPVESGERVIQSLRDAQSGRRGEVNAMYDALENNTYTYNQNGIQTTENVMDYKVPSESASTVNPKNMGIDVSDISHISYFEKTLIAMQELKKSDSKLLSNKDYSRVNTILNEVLDNADKQGFTIRDMDRARTNFRQDMDLALQNGEVTKTGSGTVATKMYSAMTEDFYSMLEKVTANDPNNQIFPAGFADDIKLAKAEWKLSLIHI